MKALRVACCAPGRTVAPLTVVVLALFANACGAANPKVCTTSGDFSPKFNPGHYVAMTRKDTAADFAAALSPGVIGIQVRYRWRELEPVKDKYDFSRIRAELDAVAGLGGQLVVFIQDKSFDSELPAPEYLSNRTFGNRAGGYTVARWQPEVVARFNKLTAALADEFDCHPSFEGIALQESALSLEDDVLSQNGYSAASYADALVEILRSAAESMPHSQVFWYMNFLPRNQRLIAQIAESVAPLGVAMGGPDVLPDSTPLVARAYPFYQQFHGQMTLFGSMQFDSYAHMHKSGPAAGEYWSLEELFEFARDELHVDYLFWNRKTWQKPAGSYDWLDAADFIARHPQIRRTD